MKPERRGSRASATFLGAFLIAPLAYSVCIILFGLDRSVGPVPIPLVVLWTVVIVGVIAWLRFPRGGTWGWPTAAWMVSVLVAWGYASVISVLRDEKPAGSLLVVAILLVLLLHKRPISGSVLPAADAFAWAFVISVVVILVLEMGELVPNWYVLSGVDDLGILEFDEGSYWLPLNGPLGIDGRWGGPLRHPNLSGVVGAFVLVYGFTRPRWRGLTFSVVGTVMLLLACSRGSYAAAAAGLVLLAVLPGWGAAWGHVTPRRITAMCVGLLAALPAVWRVQADLSAAGGTTLTGRTDMWPQFLLLLDRDPILGVGDRVISDAVASGDLPPWAYHAHNLWIDSLVRIGILGVALTAAVLVGAAFLAALQARQGTGASLSLMSVLLVMSLVEVLVDWRYPTPFLSLLIIVVVLSTERWTYPGWPTADASRAR